MRSLVLRLAGPQQSWGAVRVTGDVIPTRPVPTRAGLVGMLASSLGAARGQWPTWLDDVQFSVRVDRKGTLTTDFQTVNKMPERLGELFWRQEFAAGRERNVKDLSKRRKTAIVQNGSNGVWTVKGVVPPNIINRQYLADAEFLVAINSPTHLPELERAVRNPVFCTYLGRKAYTPTFPFILGVYDGNAATALATIPTVDRRPGTVGRLIYPITTDNNTDRTLHDVPTVPTRTEQLAWLSQHLAR